MVTEVVIKDNTKSPLEYISNLSNFKNGTIYNFKPYINVVVGPNGCGKSTLLRLISMYHLCEKTMYSRVPNDHKDLPHFWDVHREQGDMMLNGVEVKSDYCGICFRYKPAIEFDADERNRTVENLALVFNSRAASIGQQSVQALRALFHQMFSAGTDLQFPANDLKRLFKNGNVNDIWKANWDQLQQYYRDNQVIPNEEDYQYTVLLDEPDRNLDITNVKDVYTVLSTQKEMTQVIAVIHNPVLIYRLSKISHVNFIEMEEGYVKKIVDFVEGKDNVKYKRKYSND